MISGRRQRMKRASTTRQPAPIVRAAENRTARLTILIDPDKKKLFEDICAAQDLTPSQVVRRLIRQYIIGNAGNRKLPEWLLNATGHAETGLREPD